MTQIYEIQAVFNANRTTTEDYSEDVQLQAVDKAGNVLPVTIDPARVTGKVEVIAPKKDVTLTVSPTGDLLRRDHEYGAEVEEPTRFRWRTDK